MYLLIDLQSIASFPAAPVKRCCFSLLFGDNSVLEMIHGDTSDLNCSSVANLLCVVMCYVTSKAASVVEMIPGPQRFPYRHYQRLS